MLLLLAACMPSKQASLRYLADAGGVELACAHADGAHQETVQRALLQASTVRVSMEVVPVEAFVAPPDGYGADWWVVNVGIEQHGPVDRVELDLQLPGYSHRAFDPGFVASRWPEEKPDERPEPDLAGAVRSTWGDLWNAAAAVGSLVILPLTGTWDLMMLLADGGDGRVDGGMPYLTPHLASYWIGPLRQGGTTPRPQLGTIALEQDTLVCDRDLCSTRLILTPSPGAEPRLTATLSAGACEAPVVVDLPAGEGSIEQVLTAWFAPEGTSIPLEMP